MEKPDLQKIQDSDTPKLRIITALADLDQIDRFVKDRATLTNKQPEIIKSLERVMGDLKRALDLLKKESRNEKLNG
ncbi:MAG: hypothetical protein ORN54_06005 [Cyclobacteriaceae bacterium]|nr:hypothetical protein [Cyclobacteriaceae bacterium]